ncbi:hypothetical protein CL619_04050 [archaeon]|nr:hypothetical protein [archaeon]|tara:strand:+ start:162 stop:791 length:630 start_codon:yes stop_codon:yes gene_type:complete
MKRMIASLGLVALLGACDGDGDRLEGNGGVEGSEDDPSYVVAGSCSGSFMLQGDGHPVGFSTGYADNPEFRVDYKEIGLLDGSVIIISADGDFGDNYQSGIGTYEILEDEMLTPENSLYFDEGYFDTCPDEYSTCLPFCEDGQIWGDSLNDKIDRLGGFLLRFNGEGTDENSSFNNRIYTAFLIEGPWSGGDACSSTEEADYSGDCSNL